MRETRLSGSVTVLLILAVVVIVFVAAGCSKVSQENYSKISVGMDYQVVVGLLGKADKCDDLMGATSCVWGDDTRNIAIKFVADKVVLRSAKGL